MTPTTTPSDDGRWLRQRYPNATPDQCHDFTERVGMKTDDPHPPADILEKARMEAFIEMGFADD